MATNYPTSLDSFTNPTSGDTLSSVPHATQHANANDAIAALEAKVGINSSAVTTSHDYKLSGITGTDKAMSKTGTETATNKTFTAPIINVGSDATGDMYYRNSGGAFTRLPIGTSGQVIQTSSGGIPEWVSNPAASDASTTVKGVVEIATTAEITAGTSSGGTGAKLVVPADAVGTTANKIVQLDSSAKLPAVDGSQLTNLANPITYKCGQTTKNAADASTTQTIAHGLGKTPKIVRITAICKSATSSSADQGFAYAHTVYNGTTQASISNYPDTSTPTYANAATFTINAGAVSSATTTGVVTCDSTNISIAWTKTGSPTGTFYITWEAEA